MTKQETAEVLRLVSLAYNRQVDDLMVNAWSMFFAKDHKDDVLAAVQYLMENGDGAFMPTVPQIKQTIKKLLSKNSIDIHKAFSEIERAARNSAYNSVEEYNRLSDFSKSVVGSPSVLREYARMDMDRFYRDVMKGIKNAADESGEVPEAVQKYVEARNEQIQLIEEGN